MLTLIIGFVFVGIVAAAVMRKSVPKTADGVTFAPAARPL
jgi:hypothetical protein